MFRMRARVSSWERTVLVFVGWPGERYVNGPAGGDYAKVPVLLLVSAGEPYRSQNQYFVLGTAD
jgi:hypothetical protein